MLPLHARHVPHLRDAQGDGLPDWRRCAGLFRHATRPMVLKLPESMTLDGGHGRTYRCRGPCTGSGRRCRGSKRVVVLGAGPIGNLAAQVARGLGAKAVMITDVSAYKLAKARQCGIEFVVDSQTEDLGEAISRTSARIKPT